MAHLFSFQDSLTLSSSTTFSKSSHPVFTTQAPNSPQPHDPSLSWNGPLELFDMDTQGCITGIHEILLNQGNFIEVDTEFNLITSRGRSKPPNLRIFLACKQLLRLSSMTATHTVHHPFPHPFFLPTDVYLQAAYSDER